MRTPKFLDSVADDSDSSVGFDCYEDDFCELDLDDDGVSYCDDCDDFDSNETRSFGSCDSASTSCEISGCGNDFDCQLLAEDYLAADDPICSNDSVSCMECLDGCCEITN